MNFSDLDLERYLVGDLDQKTSKRIEEAASQNTMLAKHLESRRERKKDFELPPLGVPAQTSTPKPLAWKEWFGFKAWPVLAAAAVACALFFMWPSEPPATKTVRTMGGSLQPELVVKREDRVFRYSEEVPLREGDEIRIQVNLATPMTCRALGVNKQGQEESYYEKQFLDAGRSVFPGSLRLDASIGQEQIRVFCEDESGESKGVVNFFKEPLP